MNKDLVENAKKVLKKIEKAYCDITSECQLIDGTPKLWAILRHEMGMSFLDDGSNFLIKTYNIYCGCNGLVFQCKDNTNITLDDFINSEDANVIVSYAYDLLKNFKEKKSCIELVAQRYKITMQKIEDLFNDINNITNLK